MLLFLSRRWRKLPGRGRCPVSLKGSKGSPVNEMLQTALSSVAFHCCWFCGKKRCYQIPHSEGFVFSSSNLFVDLSWFCESIRKCLSIRMHQVPAKKNCLPDYHWLVSNLDSTLQTSLVTGQWQPRMSRWVGCLRLGSVLQPSQRTSDCSLWTQQKPTESLVIPTSSNI